VTELQITYSTIHSDDELLTSDIHVLVELIHNAISTNNSVGFLHTTTKSELIEFWQNEINELETANTFLIARDGIRIVGIVILTRETRPNGRHRAELRKLIVHSEYQRNGIAQSLERHATDLARDYGLKLLYLDSATDFLVERVYESWGWQKAGSIPDYSSKPDGTLEPTTYFYKHI
jgi:GNAT superfamily N-acetyltransferase